MADTTPQVSSSGWILDSRATAHICKLRSAFKSFAPEQAMVGGINEHGPQLAVEEQGEVNLLVIMTGCED